MKGPFFFCKRCEFSGSIERSISEVRSPSSESRMKPEILEPNSRGGRKAGGSWNRVHILAAHAYPSASHILTTRLTAVSVILLFWAMQPLMAQTNVPARPETNQVAVVELEGRAEVSRAGSALWDPAYTNQVLVAGDRLRTGERSRAV